MQSYLEEAPSEAQLQRIKQDISLNKRLSAYDEYENADGLWRVRMHNTISLETKHLYFRILRCVPEFKTSMHSEFLDHVAQLSL